MNQATLDKLTSLNIKALELRRSVEGLLKIALKMEEEIKEVLSRLDALNTQTDSTTTGNRK